MIRRVEATGNFGDIERTSYWSDTPHVDSTTSYETGPVLVTLNVSPVPKAEHLLVDQK